MNKIILYTIFFLLIPILILAQVEKKEEFQRTVLSILYQKLQQKDDQYTQELLKQIVEETEISTNDIHERLLKLLDILDMHRKRETDIWRQVVNCGGKQVVAKDAEKFIRHLSERVRDMLKKKRNYSLDFVIDQAAKKVPIMPYQGRYFLLQVLGMETNGCLSQVQQGSHLHEIQLIVKAQSSDCNKKINSWLNYETSPFYTFFRTRDKSEILNQTIDIHKFILPLLVPKLNESPHIKRAMEDTAFSSSSDQFSHILLIEFTQFGFKRLGPGSAIMPCIWGSILFQDMKNKSIIFRNDFEFCSKHTGVTVRTLKEFHEEVAKEIYRMVDEFLKGNKNQ